MFCQILRAGGTAPLKKDCFLYDALQIDELKCKPFDRFNQNIMLSCMLQQIVKVLNPKGFFFLPGDKILTLF